MFKTLENSDFKNKNILLRADLNVPLLHNEIIEKSRIDIIKPTIKKLREKKNKIFILSHFGRPKGKRDDKYSLKFICPTLKEEFQLNNIFFLENLNNQEIKKTLHLMNPGDVCLFENIRFYPEEESNDSRFIKNLCQNFDLFVNDAFSVSHRQHASIVGAPKFLPSFAGYSLIEEIKNINLFINKPKKPTLAIIGGSKISTKIDLLDNLTEYCDAIVIGGAMANTFLFAKKINIGKSLCEKDFYKNALSIMEKAKMRNCEIILPIDVVSADGLHDEKNIRECEVADLNSLQMILDIGTKTTKLISKYILQSKMILWNGPLGAFEYKPFEKSSIDIANVINKNSKRLNISVLAGGGDTIAVINLANAEDGFFYISKAGGAFLEWLEGKESPGVIALKKNKID